MEELSRADLKLLFEDELYLIPEVTQNKVQKEEQNIKLSAKEPLLAEEPAPESLKIKYKGDNVKEIAIIINDDSNEYLNNTDETLLLNILKAIGLSLNDVALINQNNSGTNWVEELAFTKAIVFGVLPSTYGIIAENYEIFNENNKTWLFSDSLFALGSDKVLKGKLWHNLQELVKLTQ